MSLQISLAGTISTIVISVGIYFFGTPQQSTQALFGGALITVNLLVLSWALRLIFIKKSVALAIVLIVSKYAGLILLLIALYRNGWVADLGFLLGVMVLFPVLFVIARNHLNERAK